MRFIPNRSFGYPVVGQEDYLWPDKTFSPEVTCDLRQVGGRPPVFEVNARFRTDVAELHRLLVDGTAVCVVWVYCSATLFRTVLRASGSSTTRFSATIPAGCLRGVVELHPLIVAVGEGKLSLGEAHSFYEGGEVPLQPGMPLAVHHPTVTSLLDPDRRARSIFQFETVESAGRVWDVRADPDAETVVLVADSATRQLFDLRRVQDRDWPVRTLYLAALVETLRTFLDYTQLPDGGSLLGEGGSERWVDTISREVQRIGVEVAGTGDGDRVPGFVFSGTPRSATWVAQKLLRNPLWVTDPGGEEV